ncbi:MAG TPA: T9SS type A sorting domain-containing protein, partial [Bacteroidales bacterium]|nr:T9SS type A sorting domain-containing protein [Bacteroidales bacterium]
ANNDTISLLFFAFLSKEQWNIIGIDQFIPQTKLIDIFPNPFKDKIIITLSSDINISEINLMVYNSIGQKILYNSNLKNNQLIIDLADEPNGLYYLIIRDNNKIIRTEKIIKH